MYCQWERRRLRARRLGGVGNQWEICGRSVGDLRRCGAGLRRHALPPTPERDAACEMHCGMHCGIHYASPRPSARRPAQTPPGGESLSPTLNAFRVTRLYQCSTHVSQPHRSQSDTRYSYLVRALTIAPARFQHSKNPRPHLPERTVETSLA